jgi:two-component system response regulator YesN
MRVLIVDDEVIIREGLRSHIDWAAVGFAEIMEVENALKALEIIELTPPDLIITDIFMPEMSGLEFAKTVRGKYPEIRFVILTGYEKFEYAKEAIEIGVHKYLVKPIFPEELKETAQEIYDQIQNERINQNWNETAQIRLNQYRPMVLEKFWSDLIDGALSSGQIQERAAAAELSLPYEGYGCTSIKINNLDQAKQRYGETDIALIKFAIRNITEEILNDKLISIIDCSPSTLMLILNTNISPGPLEHLHECFRSIMKIECCIGIGKWHAEIVQIALSSNQALEAASYLNMLGEHGIIRYEDIPSWKKTYATYPFEAEKDLVDCLRYREQGHETAFESFVANLLLQNSSLQMTRLVFLQLLGTIYRLADEFGVETLPEYHENVSRLERIESFQDIRSFFYTLFNEIIAYKQKYHSSYVNQLVEQAKAVMCENFRNSDVSVSVIAKIICITPNYLSRIFHKKTDKTCVEFITDLRLQEAKKLLAGSSLKTYEIAEKVGYINSHYFSYMFKKNTGESPSEYRIFSGKDKL